MRWWGVLSTRRNGKKEHSTCKPLSTPLLTEGSRQTSWRGYSFGIRSLQNRARRKSDHDRYGAKAVSRGTRIPQIHDMEPDPLAAPPLGRSEIWPLRETAGRGGCRRRARPRGGTAAP